MRRKTERHPLVTDKWGKEAGIELVWTQEEYGFHEKRSWKVAHGMVWSTSRPSQYLASVYVRDGTYGISVFGLYGLTLKQHKALTEHLERDLGMTKRENRDGI